MNIREIHENKKQFLPLLLLADEQEDMIDRYLERRQAGADRRGLCAGGRRREGGMRRHRRGRRDSGAQEPRRGTGGAEKGLRQGAD